MASLAGTYAWANEACIDTLGTAVAGAGCHPLLAVGSGGSLSAAHLAAYLHERYAGRIANAVTPLEALASPLGTRDLSALFLSAGGRNPDILGAMRQVALREPRQLAVLTAARSSPLALLAAGFTWVDAVHVDLPTGKDGFLATNSLLAFAVLLARAYEQAFDASPALPRTLSELSGAVQVDGLTFGELEPACAPLWSRRELLVLYGPSAYTGAADLESRFSEAALGSVHLADYRNFAHGRHHWLAKRAGETALLAILTDDDHLVATRTLSLIPPHIPCARIEIAASGVRAAVAALVAALYVAGAVGSARGVDPGRPGVPNFGRRIYGARTLDLGHRETRRAANAARPIERKAGAPIERLERIGTLGMWQEAQRAFARRLGRERFGALAIDYDGTLCSARDRLRGWSGDAPREVARLLRSGVLVGIATGRGDSVRADLRRELEPALWERVVMGYHNGAEIGLLSDDAVPDPAVEPVDALAPVAAVLAGHPWLPNVARCSTGRHQISLRPRRPNDAEVVWIVAQEIVERAGAAGVSVLRSGHAVDVVAPAVSKSRLVTQLRTMLPQGARSSVLCIGDRGAWPGNDGALLGEPLALSADEVSSDPETCWNLAPAGLRGVEATLGYLRAIEVDGSGSFRVRMRTLGATA